MKAKRNFIHMLISLIILASLTVGSSAQYVPQIDNISNNDIQAIEKSLAHIAFEKEYYGLPDIDINELYIGKNIPAYEIISGSLKPLDMTFYPIFDENDVLVIMAAVYYVNDEIAVSLSDTLVDLFCDVEHDDELVLIYDDSGVHLLSNGAITNSREDLSDTDFGRDSIYSLNECVISNVDGTALKANIQLSIIPTIQLYGEDDDSVYLSVPGIPQPEESDVCWAACMSSVASYKLETKVTWEDVFKLCGSPSGGMTTQNMVKNINKHYNLNYYYTDLLNSNNIDYMWYSLNRDNPVMGGFVYSTGGHHAMVIRGMYYGLSFSVMDPLEQNNAEQKTIYRRGEITRSGNSYIFTIASWTNASVLTLENMGLRAG